MSEQMKPSGIDYIGIIPCSWSIKRFKYCAQICNGSEYADIEVEEGGYPVIGSGGEFARASKYSYNGQSVLLGRKGTIDKPLFIDGAFWCVDTMFYTRPQKNQVSKFLYYCTLCFRFDYYVTSTALPSMTQKDLGSEYIAVPSMSEQQSIADFLDKQCGKIDGIIIDLEKQIETLQKYKKSLILETVTKGLNKNAPMKPSGIDWIGDIPAHWAVKRYKYCGNVQYGYPFDSNYFTNEETGFPLIRIRDITSGNIETYYEGNYPKEYIVQKGDVLIGMDGDFNIRIWDNEKALLNQRCCRILDHKQTSKRFMAYYLLNQLKLINDLTWSTTVKHLLAEDIKNIYVTIPSIEEQEQIADYLDCQCRKIDSILKDKQQQLEKIRQHKKSLIYEYVTGKKRVKEATNVN